MQLSNDWHKRTNKRLFDILSDIMKESNAPKIPDHGYTIAERAPEVVTAPGVYFPSEKGRVIPLESRQLGGRVVPKKSRIQQLEEAAGISEPTPETVPAPEPPPATPPPKGFIAPPYTGPRPWRKDIPTGSRQSVGVMAPKSTGTVRQILERLASYSPFPIPGVTTQKEEKLIPLADIMVDKKKTPLLPRQNGGEVDPNLFKNTFSVNYGDPTQNGIKTEANTALVESTPINVSPVSTPSSQPYVSQDGASLASTITPSTSPPTGMAEYEANVRKIRGLPPETGTPTINQTGGQPNQLSAYAPPGFKENTRSPVFGSDQLAAYNKKYGIDQEPDLYERLKVSSDLSGMKPTTTGAPVVSSTKIARPTATPTPPPPPPNPADEWIEEAERKRQRAFRNSAYTLFPDAMPLLSRQGGGPTSPDPDEGLTEEERKRRKALLKTESPTESLASQEATEIPKAETQGDFYEMRKEILPSGETRYTLPGTEGTATVGPERFFVGEKEVPKGTPEAVSGDELARQRILREATPPDLKSLKLPEETYYGAHPEELLRDQLREENKPLLDAYNKLIEENTRRAQGFGLPMDTRAARVIQAEAAKAGSELAHELGQAINRPVAGSGRGAAAPHLVNVEGGQVWKYPPSLVHPQGLEIPAGRGEPRAPSDIKTFETFLKNKGVDPEKIRGTPSYEEEYRKFKSIGPEVKRETEAKDLLTDEDARWVASKIGTRAMAPTQIRSFVGIGSTGQKNLSKIVKHLRKDYPEYNFAHTELAFSGDRTEINKNKQLQASVLTFEKTAIQNAKQVVALSDEIDRTRVPVLNEYIVSGKALVGGTPVEAQYIASWRTLINEYARIATSVTGGGVTSDQARREIETVLKKGYTKEQVESVVKQLVLEMEHRRYGFESSLHDVMTNWGEEPKFKPKLPTAEDIDEIFQTTTPLVGAAGKNTLKKPPEKVNRPPIESRGGNPERQKVEESASEWDKFWK